MTEWHQEPMTPERAARNRRVIGVLAVLFVISCVAVFFWGFTVTAATRARAATTDAALRSMAWSILCYAGANGGVFPTGDAALEGVDARQGPLPTTGWPASREQAMEGKEYLAPAECGAVGVTWPSGGPNPGFAAPMLNCKGNPSGFGTLDAVNAWLAEYARSRVAAKAP